MLKRIVPPGTHHVICKNKIQTFQISKFIVFKNKCWSNLSCLHLTKYVITISGKRFLCYIYIHKFLSSSWEENIKLLRELLSNILLFFFFLYQRKQWKAFGKYIFQLSRGAKFQISSYIMPAHTQNMISAQLFSVKH